MNPIIKSWLLSMYEQEIEEAISTRSNEHLWELGYRDEGPNPHTENVALLNQYIEKLEILKEELI